MPTISNFDDIIDSRDVIARIEELRAMLPETAMDVMPGTADELEAIREELAALEALAEQGEQSASDWQYGETLIRDSYFRTYAQELLEDCGDIPKNLPHYIEIDWQATARNIRVDYTAIEFNGVTYWIR